MKMEPKQYTEWEICNFADRMIAAEHKAFAQLEQKHGMKCYDTFGEWKKTHQTNPLAAYTFPENEYLQVISAHLTYFKIKYPPKTFNEITIGSTVNEITL
jgi:hypothetical protein